MLYNCYMVICMHTITIYSFHLKYFILYFYTEIAIMWVNALNFLFKQIQTNMTKNILREIKWWKYWIIKTTDNEHFLSLFIFSFKTPYQILQSKVESENMHVHLDKNVIKNDFFSSKIAIFIWTFNFVYHLKINVDMKTSTMT